MSAQLAIQAFLKIWEIHCDDGPDDCLFPSGFPFLIPICLMVLCFPDLANIIAIRFESPPAENLIGVSALVVQSKRL